MSRLTPVSVPPNEVATDGIDSVIRVTYRDGTGVLHADWPVSRIEESLRDAAGILWVDIQGPEEHSSPHVEDWLREVFRFHPLAIEDALKKRHVPKVDDWGDYCMSSSTSPGSIPTSDDLELQELDIFLGLNYLVTYHTCSLGDPRSGARRTSSAIPGIGCGMAPITCSSASSSWPSISRSPRSSSSTSESMRSRTR